MELHQLRYLAAVARTSSFSRAAEQCHVAQPSLSQQIQKLEEEMGERLFDRLKTGTKLTAAGEAFLPRALRILDEVGAAQREARDTRSLTRGTLTVGVLPTIAPYLLPAAIADFSAKYPGVEMVVHEETTSRLLKLATACEVDLAILSLPVDAAVFEVETLFTEELLVALPATHRLAKRRSIKAAELDGERFIVMKEDHCLGDQVLRFCDRREFQPNVSCRSAQIETVQALVQAGMGLSLIPKMACRKGDDTAPVYRRMDEPRPQRTIVAAWPRARPPGRAAQEFLAVMRGS